MIATTNVMEASMPSIRPIYIIHEERGMATLITSLVLLLAITLLSFAAARVGIMEQRISANDYRAKQGFEAAQAGIEYAIAMLQDPARKALYIRDNGSGIVDPRYAFLSGTLVDTGSTYTVVYSNPILSTPPNFNVLNISSTGSSDSGSRYVANQVVTFTSCCTLPPAPGNARRNIEVKGTSSLTNPDSSVAAWAGGSVKKNGAATITNNSGGASTGIAKNDLTLGNLTNDAFFQNFFNGSKDSIKNLSEVYTGAGNYSATLSSVTSTKIIWITGDVTINSTVTIGSASAPVVLIVEGALTISTSAIFNGIAYSTGDMKVIGSAQLNGAAISESAIKIAGNAQVAYNRALLNNILNNAGSFAKIGGAWTDL